MPDRSFSRAVKCKASLSELRVVVGSLMLLGMPYCSATATEPNDPSLTEIRSHNHSVMLATDFSHNKLPKAPDFMAALRKAVTHSEELLSRPKFTGLEPIPIHQVLALNAARVPLHLYEPQNRLQTIQASDTANDWFEDNHVTLVGNIGNHNAQRWHLMVKQTCVQDSDTFCEAKDDAASHEPSLLLNGFADQRAAYGVHIGLNIKF